MNHSQQEFQKIAFAITHGDFETAKETPCSYCGMRSLEYSFTVKELPDRYGFFLVCKSCHRWLHASIHGRPPNFREDRVIASYQEREDRVVKFAKEVLSKRYTESND